MEGNQYLEDDLTEDEYLEIPSCLESLTNSAGQLRQLTLQADQYYGQIFLCYGHAYATSWTNLHLEPSKNVADDEASRNRMNPSRQHNIPLPTSASANLKSIARSKSTLEKLDSTLRMLPLLIEFGSFIDRCSATIESAIRRMTYYLNKQCEQQQQQQQGGRSTVKGETFQLTREARVDAILVALMDLMFALIKLDDILTNHTSVRQNLDLFLSTCKLASSGNDPVELDLPRAGELEKLIECLSNVRLTLTSSDDNNKNGTNLFQQSVNHVQHLHLILAKDKTGLGFERLGQLMGEYLIFFAENLADISVQSTDHSNGNTRTAKLAANILINANLVPASHLNRPSRRILGLLCLFILCDSLFKRTDRKVLKAINQSLQRTKPCNMVPLGGLNGYILLDDFLRENAPKASIESKTYDLLSSDKETSHVGLAHLDVGVLFERLLMRTTPWLINLESESLDFGLGRLENWPRKQVDLFDRGLRLAEEIGDTMGAIDLVHRHYGRPMSKANSIGLFRLSALLKAIESSFEQHDSFVFVCLTRIEQLVRTKWRQALAKMQRRQISTKYSERKLDLDSMLLLAAIGSRPELLSSSRGRDTLAVCLPMLFSSLNLDELQDLRLSLGLLRLDFHTRLRAAATCDHLYWHLAALGDYYNHALEQFPGTIDELHYFLRGLTEMASLFEVAHRPIWSGLNLEKILAKTGGFLARLAMELQDQFKSDFLGKICQEFEVELRLQTHRDLYTEEHNNPFRRPLYNFKQLIKRAGTSTRFTLFGQTIDLNRLIEHHVNKVCYNLTSIAPHDWFTYDSMMNLARHKFNHTFVETQLPAQTLDSGLDLLDITRNLSLFASRYSYDLTNQLFIEKCSGRASTASSVGASSMLSSYAAASSSSQSLNVLQSKHVAQSIQTHGYGILDSAINCAYQALKRLVNLFARQLSDDKLRATLQKERQQFLLESGPTPSGKPWAMSFERANRIAKQFRLTAAALNESMDHRGADSAHQSNRPAMDLDSVRQTVTQLGNLLALIRLIKSGALNCVSKSVDYLPELGELANLRLSKCAEREFAHFKLQAPLLSGAQNFDECLSDFQENFSPKTNYLGIIVTLFTDLLSSRRQNNGANNNENNDNNNNNSEGNVDQQQEARQRDEERRKISLDDANNKREHLKLFFLLIPPLIINHIDHLINCKERVSARSSLARFGALLSDDGFAIGIAFLLTVLGQSSEHHKLDWLARVCGKIREDIEEIVGRASDPKYEEPLRQTSSMTIRRLTRLLAEYVALEQALNCALLLFSSANRHTDLD